MAVAGAPASYADLGAGTAAAPAAGLAGFVVAPNADGVAIRTVRVGYRPGSGALYAVATLNRELPNNLQAEVRFGHQGPGGAGCVTGAATVTFTGGSGAARWTGDITGGAGPLNDIEVAVPRPTAEIASALRSTKLIGQSIDCARAAVLGSATIPVAQTPVDVHLQAAAAVPTVSGFGRPMLQLNYRYGAALPLRHGRVEVSVTCVAARKANCSGELRINQQFSHRLLGRAPVFVPLGGTVHILVSLHLPAKLAHAQRVPATATLEALHGVSSVTTFALTR
jgi:hypothetical protein